MDKIIKTILAEWKGKNIPEVIARETNIQDYLNMKVNKIIVLNGFRRVGMMCAPKSGHIVKQVKT